MKRKQKEPRRVRPTETPDELDKEASAKKFSDGVSDEPEAESKRLQSKRLKSDLETPTENSCDTTDYSEWKWNIADFRKEHAENTKEQSKNSKEHSDQLEELPSDSKDPSMNSNESCDNLERSKESLNNSKESCDNLERNSKESSNNSKQSCDNLERSKESSNNSEESCDNFEHSNESSKSSQESVNNSKEYEKNSEEIGEGLKEFHLRNPPQVFRKHTGAAQSWKLPVRSLKEPSSYLNQKPQSSELNSNTNLSERNAESKNFKNELQNDDMPVILNVFSLSKQFVRNTKQENSFLFTPPCTPPLVQLGAFSAIPVANQNPRFRNDFAKQAAFQQRSDVNTSDVSEQWREYWYNTPVKRIHRNAQGYLSYQVQQVNNSQEYSNKPAQQVYYNPQEYLSKPVQHASSQVYLNKPVQQVYHNPQENSSKPVNSQAYLNQSVQQVNPNPTEYLSNPVQQANLQEYLYNPAQDINYKYNPQQIANGVLPLEKQSSNQRIYETQIQPNSTQYYTQGYYVDNNEQTPISLLHKRGSSLTKDNGMYARFKLRQEMVENSRKFHRRTNLDILPQFFEPPSVQNRLDIYIPPIVEQIPVTQQRSDIYIPPIVRNQADISPREATVVFSNPPSTLHSPNAGNGLPNYGDAAISVGKYRTENGCSVVLDGYGKNRVLDDGAGDPTMATNNNPPLYNAKPLHLDNSYGNLTMVSDKTSLFSENPYGSPTMVSEKQFCSDNSFGSPTMVPGTYGVAGEPGNAAESLREFLSPRDAKVIQLKQRLEEQEATLKKLRATH